MTNKRIHLCLPRLSGEEMHYVREAFDTNWIAPLGPNVEGFEDDLKKYLDAGMPEGTSGHEVVALNSGTAALHLSLLHCGVGPGDEVIVQDFTFCASANAVVYTGARPVFVDSEPGSWNMSPELLEEAILDRISTVGKLPKAIMVVAAYGMPYDVDGILSVANKHGIPVIEDVAEALGSRWRGRALGTFGALGVLSFNGNKMITTSSGGAVVCPDREAWNQIMWLATQARESYPYYQHEAVGYNYRLSNVCAGIGRGQMTILEDNIAHHRHLKEVYGRAFAGVQGLELHSEPDARGFSNFWMNTITIDPRLHVRGQEKAYDGSVFSCGGVGSVPHAASAAHTDCEPGANVEALRRGLDAAGVESRPLLKPMHCQPIFRDLPAYVNGVGERLLRTGLCLPSGPLVSEEDALYIASCLLDLID